MTVLAAAAGLADVLAFRLRLLADRLAVGHLRLADVGLHVELAHHAVDDDLQVQLAHAADDGLAAVGIGVDVEGRVFLRQLAQRDAHLFLVAPWFWARPPRKSPAPGNSIDSSTIGCFSSQMVSPVVTLLQSDAGADVAGVDLADLFTLVGVHLQQAADALALAVASTDVHAVARFELAGVHTDKRRAGRRTGRS